jgi:hypothetical protein
MERLTTANKAFAAMLAEGIKINIISLCSRSSRQNDNIHLYQLSFNSKTIIGVCPG